MRAERHFAPHPAHAPQSLGQPELGEVVDALAADDADKEDREVDEALDVCEEGFEIRRIQGEARVELGDLAGSLDLARIGEVQVRDEGAGIAGF